MISITWDNAKQKAAGMNALAAKVAGQHTHLWGESVALKGEQTVREVIMAGGMNGTKKGGPRYDTGAMYGSAESKTVSGGGTALVVAGYGIHTTTPRWTTFQEGGTKRGIAPMQSIVMATLEMGTEMDNAGRQMMARIRADWEAI